MCTTLCSYQGEPNRENDGYRVNFRETENPELWILNSIWAAEFEITKPKYRSFGHYFGLFEDFLT